MPSKSEYELERPAPSAPLRDVPAPPPLLRPAPKKTSGARVAVGGQPLASDEERRPRPGRLREALALMETIPEPEGTEAAWEAVERGIADARRSPDREG